MVTMEQLRETFKNNKELEMRFIKAYKTLFQNETDDDQRKEWERKLQDRRDKLKVLEDALASIEEKDHMMTTVRLRIQEIWLKNGLEAEEKVVKLMQRYESKLQERQVFLELATERLNKSFSRSHQDAERLEAAAAKYS